MQILDFTTALAPEIGIFVSLLGVLVASVSVEKILKRDKALVNFAAYFTIFMAALLLVYLVSFWGYFSTGVLGGYRMPLISFFMFDGYVFDFFSLSAKILLLGLFIPTVIILRAYLVAERIYAYEYFVLLLIALLGMFIMTSCQDFLLFYVALEIQALSFYALAAMRTDSLYSAEAGVKYFIIGVLASLVILFGIALLYGYTGSTNFNALALFFGYAMDSDLNYLPIIALACLWLGLFVKLGVVPVHFWTLDVYQGAPLAVMGFFSLLPKVTLVAMFLRFQYYVFGGPWAVISPARDLGIGNSPNLVPLELQEAFPVALFRYLGELFPSFAADMAAGRLGPVDFAQGGSLYSTGGWMTHSLTFFIALGLLSVVVGSIGGLGQTNLKRLFAYSSVTNVGFILLTFAGLGINAFQATIFYLVVYVLLTLNFFIILALFHLLFKRPIYSINDLSGVGLAFSLPLALNLFALAGIPPTAGFAIKFYVYYVLVEAGYYYTAAVVVVASVLAIFFYLRLIALLFFSAGKISVVAVTATLPTDVRFTFIGVTFLTNVFLIYFLPELFHWCWTFTFLCLS